MGEIQWGLLDPNSFQRGYQSSKGMVDDITGGWKKQQADAAMRQYALHPDDPNSINALAQVDPAAAITARQQQQTNHLKQLDAHRESIKVGAQIIRAFNVKDEPSYQAAKKYAADNGVDISQLPPAFDPQYIQNVVHLADALSPEKVTNSRIITPQPGGGAWELGADGTLKPLIQPNDGSQAVGAPIAAGNAPTVTDQASYDAIPPGGQYMSPDGHIRVKQGGPTPQASGGFL